MHLVFGVVQVLTLLDVLASQAWDANFYPTRPGIGFPHYPFQQYGYNNYATNIPYGHANSNFHGGYPSGRMFSGQGNRLWSGLIPPQNSYAIFPDFEIPNNQLEKGMDNGFLGVGRIQNGENYVRKDGPSPYFPPVFNSMAFFQNPQQEFPKTGNFLTIQPNTGISEATKNINDVPFFKPMENKLNTPGEQINNINTFGQQNFKSNGREWEKNSISWPPFPNSEANFYQFSRNDNGQKASPFPLVHSGGQAMSRNDEIPASSRNVQTFVPAQGNNNQNEFNKYGTLNSNIQADENKMFSQKNLVGFGSPMIPLHYLGDITASIREYPPQTVPTSKTTEQNNFKSFADVSSRNSLPEPITGNNLILNNQISWPLHQDSVQYDFNLNNQESTTAVDLSHREIKNTDLLGKPEQFFAASSDYPFISDNTFQMRDRQLHTSFIDSNENGFSTENQLKNKNFSPNEKNFKHSDGAYNSPVFGESHPNFAQDISSNSQAFVPEEFRQAFRNYDPTKNHNANMGNKLSSPANKVDIMSLEVDIKPLASEYLSHTKPVYDNIEQHNFNSLEDVSSKNSLPKPPTGNANNSMLNNRVSWPSNLNDVQYDFKLINQASTAEGLSRDEIKNTDLPGKPELPPESVFAALSNHPFIPYNSDPIRDGKLHTSFIGSNENGFYKDLVKNGNFPSNEKIVDNFDGVHNSPAFRENRPHFDQSATSNSQAFVSEEFRQEFRNYDPTKNHNAHMDKKQLLQPKNKAAEKNMHKKDRLNTVPKDLSGWKDIVIPEVFKNIVDESVQGPAKPSFRNKLTEQESLAHKRDQFAVGEQLSNEISFEEKQVSRASDFSPNSQRKDNFAEVEELMSFDVPDSYAPTPFMEQIQMIETENRELLMEKNLYYFYDAELKNFYSEITIDKLVSIILSAETDDSTIVFLNSTIFDEIFKFLSARQQLAKPSENGEESHVTDLPRIKVVTEYTTVRTSTIVDERDKNSPQRETGYPSYPTRI